MGGAVTWSTHHLSYKRNQLNDLGKFLAGEISKLEALKENDIKAKITDSSLRRRLERIRQVRCRACH